MKYILITFLVIFVGVFVLLLSQDTKEIDRKEEEKKKRDDAEKAGRKAVNSVKRQCFEAYRQQLIEERNLGLCKAALADNSGLHFLSEFFAFRDETENHRLMSYEYRNRLASRVLEPLNEALTRSCTFSGGKYTLPESFDMFLTPEEYYDQQLSYRGNAVIYQTDLEFWQERLELTAKKREKIKNEASNRFWAGLFEAMKPFFEEMQTEYRKSIDEAPSREAALLYTKDLAERIEQELYRKGLSIMWYYTATPKEREKYFRQEQGDTERPAVIRESDGICFEKGVHSAAKR